MKNRKYERTQKQRLLTLLGVVVSVLLLIVALLVFKLYSNNPATYQGSESLQTPPPIEKNPDSISIPGYELLELQANNSKQTLCLPNPEQNVCYFQISLYMEDGTLLWESEMIAPGATSKPISLIKPLDKGTYLNATLRYSCFKMDGITPLNGAETKLTLWVK